MTELIKIETRSDGSQAVLARELHRFLGVGKDFSTWFKDRVDKYKFVKNQDFILLPQIGEQKEGRGGHNIKEYVVSLDMAKELSMVENNERGREARRYFIECEKRYRAKDDENNLLLNIIKANGEEETAIALKAYREKIVIPLKTDLNNANKTIEHKVNVISYMTSDFKLQTQRQFLNEIIRMKGNANNLISERWKLLYSFYEKQKHINLSARFEAYNNTHTPKLKSKLQLIDEVMNDIPTLYKVAVKTFEADFKDKLEHYLSVL